MRRERLNIAGPIQSEGSQIAFKPVCRMLGKHDLDKAATAFQLQPNTIAPARHNGAVIHENRILHVSPLTPGSYRAGVSNAVAFVNVAGSLRRRIAKQSSQLQGRVSRERKLPRLAARLEINPDRITLFFDLGRSRNKSTDHFGLTAKRQPQLPHTPNPLLCALRNQKVSCVENILQPKSGIELFTGLPRCSALQIGRFELHFIDHSIKGRSPHAQPRGMLQHRPVCRSLRPLFRQINNCHVSASYRLRWVVGVRSGIDTPETEENKP